MTKKQRGRPPGMLEFETIVTKDARGAYVDRPREVSEEIRDHWGFDDPSKNQLPFRATPFEIVEIKQAANQVGVSANELMRLAIHYGLDIGKAHVRYREHVLEPLRELDDDDAMRGLVFAIMNIIKKDVGKAVDRLNERISVAKASSQ